MSNANIKKISAAGWIIILVSLAGDKSVTIRLGHQSTLKVQQKLSAHTAEQAFFPKMPEKQISETLSQHISQNILSRKYIKWPMQ